MASKKPGKEIVALAAWLMRRELLTIGKRSIQIQTLVHRKRTRFGASIRTAAVVQLIDRGLLILVDQLKKSVVKRVPSSLRHDLEFGISDSKLLTQYRVKKAEVLHGERFNFFYQPDESFDFADIPETQEDTRWRLRKGLIEYFQSSLQNEDATTSDATILLTELLAGVNQPVEPGGTKHWAKGIRWFLDRGLMFNVGDPLLSSEVTPDDFEILTENANKLHSKDPENHPRIGSQSKSDTTETIAEADHVQPASKLKQHIVISPLLWAWLKSDLEEYAVVSKQGWPRPEPTKQSIRRVMEQIWQGIFEQMEMSPIAPQDNWVLIPIADIIERNRSSRRPASISAIVYVISLIDSVAIVFSHEQRYRISWQQAKLSVLPTHTVNGHPWEGLSYEQMGKIVSQCEVEDHIGKDNRRRRNYIVSKTKMKQFGIPESFLPSKESDESERKPSWIGRTLSYGLWSYKFKDFATALELILDLFEANDWCSQVQLSKDYKDRYNAESAVKNLNRKLKKGKVSCPIVFGILSHPAQSVLWRTI